MGSATPEQIKELAQAVANQAQAIADGKIPHGLLYAQVAKLHDNTVMLKAWAPDDRQSRPERLTPLCGHPARKGTGTGVCDRPLDKNGYCDRAGDHLD